MKVLFVTSYFPPSAHGWGYMRICEEVADGLHDLGMKVGVLTSTCRQGTETKSYPVWRELNICPDWHSSRPAAWQFLVDRRRSAKKGVRALARLVRQWQPEIIFIWHAFGLSREMLQFAENLAQPKVVYYFADYLPEIPDEFIPYWSSAPNGSLRGLVKSLLRPVALSMLEKEGKPVELRYRSSISVSHYVRDRLRKKDLIGEDAVVIPNGVDLSRFTPDGSPWLRAECLKCLCAGRVAPEKGIHTLLSAFILLRQRGLLERFKLTITGGGPKDYVGTLRQIITDHNLESSVFLRSPIPAEEMPSLFRDNDILLLPSEWDEPLSCTMLEAMACGLLVIGTETGGSGEALLHEVTGLVFRTGSATSLADQLGRVLTEPALCERIILSARSKVETEFDIALTAENVARHLKGVIQRPLRAVTPEGEVSSDMLNTG